MISMYLNLIQTLTPRFLQV